MAVFRPPLMIFLAFIALSVPSHASNNRLAALGGAPRLLLDTDNIHIYPATAGEFPHLGVEIFQDWGGVVYPLSSEHALGLFFNRPTPQSTRFNTYLVSTEDPLLGELEVQPWVDLLYGGQLLSNAHLGLSGRFSFDTSTRPAGEASAHSLDLRLGLRLGEHQSLDAVFGLTHQRIEVLPATQDQPDRSQTDGLGYLLGLRTRLPISSSLLLLSSVDLELESYALSPSHRDFRAIHITTGINARPIDEVLVLLGVIVDYQKTEFRLPGTVPQEDEDWLLPGTLLAGEVQVGSMLFRLGMRHESRLTVRQQLRGEQRVERRDFDTALGTELGLGLEFGTLQIDGLFERDFFRDGPHFLGGSRHGGGILSQISLTYVFSQ